MTVFCFYWGKKGGKECVGYFVLLAAFLHLIITLLITLDLPMYGLIFEEILKKYEFEPLSPSY